MRDNKVLKGIKSNIDNQFESILFGCELNNKECISNLNKIDLLMLINAKFDKLLDTKKEIK